MAANRRGNRFSWLPTFRISTNRGASDRRTTSRPSEASGPAGQRSGSSTAGSLTTRRPPGRRNPVAHSNVMAGGPKARATTMSMRAASSGSRAASAASAHKAVARSVTPRTPSAQDTKASQCGRRSRKTHVEAGQRLASTSPGMPAPVPRSRQRAEPGSTRSSAIPTACAIS